MRECHAIAHLKGSSHSYHGLQHLIPADRPTAPGIRKSSVAGMPTGRSATMPVITESQCNAMDGNHPHNELQRSV